MSEFDDKIDDFLKENGIRAERFHFDNPVTSSDEATKELGVTIDNILKTVLFFDRDKNLYAVMLRGHHLVRTKEIKKEFGAKGFRMVPFEDVENICGYPAGGVPPMGFDAVFILDSSFSDDETIFAGGGTTKTLIKTSVSEIKRITNPSVLDISKIKA